MASSSSTARANPLLDLVCVAVLGLILWLTAQSVASIARQAPPPEHHPPAAAPAH